MQIKPNFLRNAEEILWHINTHHLDEFHPREGGDVHTSIIPGLYSRFNTLKNNAMSPNLINTIFKDADFDELLKDTYNFIQIQQYLPGDWIVPHKDIYTITDLHLIILTTSDSDGLVVEDGKGGLQKIYDQAGTYINVGDRYHWVNPVRDIRYSLVVTE